MSSFQSLDDDADLRRLIEQVQKSKHIPRYFRPEADIVELVRLGLDYSSMFKGKTYEELVEYVSDATGLTEAQFNAEGYKTMRDLYQECVTFDVALMRRKGDGQLFRLASNARAEIHLPSHGLSLQEVKRAFPKSGKPPIIHSVPKRHGCSETIKRNDEDPLTAMFRGFREEYHCVPDTSLLLPIEHERLRTKVGPSSVYAGTMSFVKSWMFAWYLPQPRWWPDGKMIVDGNARIYNEWLPIQT